MTSVEHFAVRPGPPVIHQEETTTPHHTQGFRFNHTMLRISDPAKSIPFYRDVLGMHQVFSINAGPMSAHFLAHFSQGEKTGAEVNAHTADREGLLELVHMHGSEDMAMTSGNFPPHYGFGHLGFIVPDVDAALTKFVEMGVEVIKPTGVATVASCNVIENGTDLSAGFQHAYKQMAMIKDPDGYFIEIVPAVVRHLKPPT